MTSQIQVQRNEIATNEEAFLHHSLWRRGIPPPPLLHASTSPSSSSIFSGTMSSMLSSTRFSKNVHGRETPNVRLFYFYCSVPHPERTREPANSLWSRNLRREQTQITHGSLPRARVMCLYKGRQKVTGWNDCIDSPGTYTLTIVGQDRKRLPYNKLHYSSK